jgi:hypothetical protein
MPDAALTKAQKSALLWLRNRNGDGMFDRNGVLLAAGQSAHVMRSTWNKLREAGLVETYGGKRLRVTDAGQTVDLKGATEPYAPEDDDGWG